MEQEEQNETQSSTQWKYMEEATEPPSELPAQQEEDLKQKRGQQDKEKRNFEVVKSSLQRNHRDEKKKYKKSVSFAATSNRTTHHQASSSISHLVARPKSDFKRKDFFQDTTEQSALESNLVTAVSENDWHSVFYLLNSNRFRIGNDSLMEKLIRCSTGQGDWKTLALLLHCITMSKTAHHPVNILHAFDAANDVISVGFNWKLVVAQQLCFHLISCSSNRQHNIHQYTLFTDLKVADLMVFCRHDDLISLIIAWMFFNKDSELRSEGFFTQLETSVQINPTTHMMEEELDCDEIEAKNLRIVQSYGTPPARRDGTEEEEEEDEREENFDRIVSCALNHRNCTLMEFSASVFAPRCTFFLDELSAGRLG